jgi:hypothetical protein
MATKKKTTNKKATKASVKIATRPTKSRTVEVAAKSSPKAAMKASPRVLPKSGPMVKSKISPMHSARVPRIANSASVAQRQAIRLARAPQFTYMNAPGVEDAFDVGNTVEVFCDHEQDGERVRGWIKGTVVQVDNKLVAVQFRSNVFLTDGWMVPDRILWYSLTSDQIHTAAIGKKTAKRVIPDY